MQKAVVDGNVVLDPSHAEGSGRQATLTLAVLVGLDEITQILAEGELPAEDLATATALCWEGCRSLHAVQRQVLLDAQS